MVSPHHRHQSSLEGVIDFSDQHLHPDERNRATRIFNRIINYYEPSQTKNGPYKQITLLRATYEYALSRDNFLKLFFLYIGRESHLTEQLSESNFSQTLSHFVNFDSITAEQKDELGKSVSAFADYLVDNFFLPCKTTCFVPLDSC
jgi:hypothetical protein